LVDTCCTLGVRFEGITVIESDARTAASTWAAGTGDAGVVAKTAGASAAMMSGRHRTRPGYGSVWPCSKPHVLATSRFSLDVNMLVCGA